MRREAPGVQSLHPRRFFHLPPRRRSAALSATQLRSAVVAIGIPAVVSADEFSANALLVGEDGFEDGDELTQLSGDAVDAG